MSGRTTQQHVQGCLETARFSEELRGSAAAKDHFAELCMRRVQETAASAGVHMSLSSEERAADDLVREFMSARMSMLEAGDYADYAQQLAAVASFSFDLRFGSVSGRAYPSARLAGVLTPSENGVLVAEYGAQKAHEFGHAAGYVEVDRNVFNAAAQAPFVHDSIAVTVEGWVMRVPEQNKRGYSELFRVCDEVAATVIANAWYESQGWRQMPFDLALTINIDPGRPFDRLLSEAIRLVVPEVLMQPIPEGPLADGETMSGVLTVPAIRWTDGKEVRRSLYAPLLQAFDMLAAEIYPNIPGNVAVPHLRQRLVETQAIGGHHTMVQQFEKAFGSEGVRFLSRLEAPGSRAVISIDTALLSLYAMAGRLHTRTDTEQARRCLHQAQDELLVLRESLGTID